MALYYGEIKGRARTLATRIGYKRIQSHVRTWTHGIETDYSKNDDGSIQVRVYETGGSDNANRRKLILDKRVES